MTVARPPSVSANRRRPIFSRLGLLILIGLSVFFLAAYTSRLRHKADVEHEIAEWEQRIAEAEQHQQELQAELDYVNSPAYIEDVARNQLDMARDGDTVIVVVKRDTDTSLELTEDDLALASGVEETNKREVPTWVEWVELLVPED